LAAGLSVREIARRLGRAASTVSREVCRNGGRGHYRAAQADELAWQRVRRPQRCVLARRPTLRAWVAERLRRDWSPRQIAVGLQHAFPDDERMRVSHETIYRSLFIQARNVLKKELLGHLRRGGFMRRPQTAPGREPAIVDGLSIHQRPAEAEDRAVPGHWEGDLLMGGTGSQIATLVERRSRYVMLVKVQSKDTRTRRWPSTSGSPSRPASRSTSAILEVLGSAAATKTPTASCVSTSPKGPTSQT